MEVVKLNGFLIQYANEAMKNDKEIAMEEAKRQRCCHESIQARQFFTSVCK
jgi:hypothetical protein